MTVLHVMKSPNFMPLHKVLSIEIVRLGTQHFVVLYMAGSKCSLTETSTATMWHFSVAVRFVSLINFREHSVWKLECSSEENIQNSKCYNIADLHTPCTSAL